MEQKQLTEWFPESVKPTRKGVYEVDCPHVAWRCFAYWNGIRFGYRLIAASKRCWKHPETPDVIDDAFRMRDCETALPALVAWRGLAQDPNAKG